MNYYELANSLKFSAMIAEEMGGKINNVDLIRKAAEAITELIARVETADVAPVVHGQWESKTNPNYPAYSHDKCSLCGWWNTRNALCYEKGRKTGHSLNYCPNCGAKMDLEEN